jgi:hypothetical protein
VTAPAGRPTRSLETIPGIELLRGLLLDLASLQLEDLSLGLGGAVANATVDYDLPDPFDRRDLPFRATDAIEGGISGGLVISQHGAVLGVAIDVFRLSKFLRRGQDRIFEIGQLQTGGAGDQSSGSPLPPVGASSVFTAR